MHESQNSPSNREYDSSGNNANRYETERETKRFADKDNVNGNHSSNTNSHSNNSDRSGSKRFTVAENSNVCRDFLNSVCFRGDSCKYDHPRNLRDDDSVREDFQFCKEYQYGGCLRSACRFVHCSRAEVLTYEDTGRVSESMARAVVAATGQRTIGGRPLCKEYINGRCSRDGRCRFWHIDPVHEQRTRRKTQDAASDRRYEQQQHERNPAYMYSPQRGSAASYEGFYSPSANDSSRGDPKRPRYDDSISAFDREFVNRSELDASSDLRFRSPTTMSGNMPSVLVEENTVLRRKIEVLKQTLNDMQAANEALLNENSRLRAKATANANAAAAAASINSATVALNGVLNNSAAAAGLSQLAGAPSAAVTSGLTPEQHMAVVSLAAAVAAQQSASGVVVHPSLAYTASSDGLQWSLAQMRR